MVKISKFCLILIFIIPLNNSYGQDRVCSSVDILAPASHDTTQRISTNLEIPVFFHVIDSSVTAGQIYDFNIDDQLDDQMDILNAAYSGTKFSFNHIGTNYINNTDWIGIGKSPLSLQIQKELHVEVEHILNVYITDLSSSLGWAENPTDLDFSNVSEDNHVWGVFIDRGTLVDGDESSYNLGDNLVHEIGHYFGLLHTWDNTAVNDSLGLGYCVGSGDLVDDTPTSLQTFGCPIGENSCIYTDPRLDPINNYMSYNDDSCMNEFTPDQIERMESVVGEYRPNLGKKVPEVIDTEVITTLNTQTITGERYIIAAQSTVKISGTVELEDDLDGYSSQFIVFGELKPANSSAVMEWSGNSEVIVRWGGDSNWNTGTMNILGNNACFLVLGGGKATFGGTLNVNSGGFMAVGEGAEVIFDASTTFSGSGDNEGYVLKIGEGATIKLGYNNKITIADGSKMRSVGTLADPVTFTYDGTYDPGVESWNGIELRGDGNIFEYTILEHGINPLYFRSDNNVVEYSTIRNNSSYGIRTDLDYSGGWGSVTITDSNIHDNGSHGVYMRKTHGGVQYTNIKDNGGDGMYVYDATVGNPNSSGSEYFRGNDIEDNSGNAVELAYNATLYDGYSTTDGNNNLGHNGSHEVYLSSTSARWHDANGGSYTAVLDNTSSKFVYNLAQTTSGESTISWTVGMENNAWNYVTPSSSKFFGSVDYTPFQTSQMFGSLGPRGSTPSEMNAGELPQMVLSASAVQAKTSGLHSDSERDAYLEQTREINKLMASINGNPQSRMVAKNLNGLIGYYNQLPENKKSEFNQVPEVLTNFIADKQLAEQVSFGEDGSRLTSETALMLQIHQQLQDGDPKGVLKSINKYKQTFSNLDIKRELGFIKANALEQLGKYDEAVAVYNELAILSRLGIDSENTATDYETLVSTLEELRAEHRGKDETSETNSLTEKVKEVVSTDEEALPTSFALKEAYPNPFNPSTVLSFDLPETGRVRVEVFNIAGQLVSVLTNQRYEAGSHSLQFNAEGLASGVYLVRANLAGTIQSQKVTLIK